MAPRHIAILGGGLSGLSSAFHLSRRFPSSRITLLEQHDRLGGWVRSERVDVEDNHGARAKILLESGPRTLRPNSNAILEMIHLLNLSSVLLTVPRTSPAAQSRFIHIPEGAGINMIPSSLAGLFTSPLSRILFPAVVGEPFRSSFPKEYVADQDESLDAFLTHHFGAEFARIFGSALVHGIYAADSRILSVRAAFPMLWDAAVAGRGSVVLGFIRRALFGKDGGEEEESYDVGDVPALMRGVSVYSFKDGMETLVKAMEDYLRQKKNVEVIKGAGVSALWARNDHDGFEVKASSDDTIHATHLVSAMPLPALNRLLSKSASAKIPTAHSVLPQLPHLTANPSSSVTVVNFVYPPSTTPIHPPGFGYLIPRPQDGYAHTDGVLGTVFDSCSLSGQDIYPGSEVIPPLRQQFTKLTMMLGGPHASIPPDPHAILAAQLGHALPKPALVRVRPHVDCIPVPSVGHLSRMREMRATLNEGVWAGRVEVIGAGVGGVSVGDCIEQGRSVGRHW